MMNSQNSIIKKFLLTIAGIILLHHASAQMTVRVIRDSLFIPWELVYGPDNHIWFTQKNGYICRLDPYSKKIDTLYHETSTVIQSEGGMLGLALHPDFFQQPYVFVAYNYQQGSDYRERIVRLAYTGTVLQNPLILLDNIIGAFAHNGCRLVIVNDKLFITTGDAANSTYSQNVQSLNGKTLRINLDGSIPADNPIPGNPVWSWGHRNAQGLVYANNKLYSSEHGTNKDDELNIIEKGRNYGWPNVEGFCDLPSEIAFCNDSNVVQPLYAWTPTLAVCGIDYYNHLMFPSLQNSILMTTLANQKLYQLQLNGSFDGVVSAAPIAGINYGRLRDICISPDGRIYISTSNSPSSGTGSRVDKIIELADTSLSVVNISESNEISISPNPAGDYTILKIPSSLGNDATQFVVINSEGKTVQKGKLLGSHTKLAIRHLPASVYQIRITTKEGKTFTGKIIKQ